MLNDIATVTRQETSSQKFCPNCNEPVADESRFCTHCGYEQPNDSLNISEQKWPDIKQIALFFVVSAIICCTVSFAGYFKTVEWSIIAEVILAIASITFFCINWSKNKGILLWPDFSLIKLFSYCAIAVISSVIISSVVHWLNQSLFSKELSYYAFYAKHSYAKELMIFFVAVMPALFEELGYRGFLLQKLLAVVDKRQSIFISAFLFAIMHTSILSLFWLIPFGLFVAYVRIKENTLWYGVCIHFSFNFTVCMIELFKY